MEEIKQTQMTEEEKKFFDEAQIKDGMKTEGSHPEESSDSSESKKARDKIESLNSMTKEFAGHTIESLKSVDDDKKVEYLSNSLMAFFALGSLKLAI